MEPAPAPCWNPEAAAFAARFALKPPPPGKVHVAVPRAMWPRIGHESDEFERRYDGKLIYIFVCAVRDAQGHVLKQGYLAHVVVETDARNVQRPATRAPRTTDDPHLAAFVRDLARMAARAWAAAACDYQEVTG